MAWSQRTLPDLGELNRGKSKHRPRDAAHLYGGKYPFLQTGDIKSSGGRVTSYSQTYSEAGLEQSRLWPKNTVAITIAANIAETGVLTFPACFPDSVVGFIANPQQSDPFFVEYKFRDLKRIIQKEYVGSGSVQDNINLGILRKMEFYVPLVEEQRRIASVLKSYDDKIELNRQMNETLERLAQATFKDWFVDFGPVNRKGTGETDAVKILGGLITDPARAASIAALFPDNFGDDGLPRDWEETMLYDQANWINGAAYKKMHFVDADDGLPVIKIAELNNGIGKQTKFTNTQLGNKFKIDNGELLFSWSGNPDTSIDTFIWSKGPAWLNQHIFSVRENGQLNKPTLYFLLKSLKPTFTMIARDKQTTGLGHVTKADMKRLSICLGSDKIRYAFNDLVFPLYEKILQNKFENQTLAETRDYLLPKLMAGEVSAVDRGETV